MKPRVLVMMGSDSDLSVVEETGKILKELGISYEMTIASAHRTPELVQKLASEAEGRGIEVIIAAAGGAAHLAGVVASHTILPVIGVPLNSSPLQGLDSLLSTVQMPPGIPVATMAVGKAGAKNAAIFAAQIMGRKDKGIVKKLVAYRKRTAIEIKKKADSIKTGTSNKVRVARYHEKSWDPSREVRDHLDCFPCFLRQSIIALRLGTRDAALQEKILKAVLHEVETADTSRPPAYTTTFIHRKIRRMLRSDPFKGDKV